MPGVRYIALHVTKLLQSSHNSPTLALATRPRHKLKRSSGRDSLHPLIVTEEDAAANTAAMALSAEYQW